jgi:hypothetical protein
VEALELVALSAPRTTLAALAPRMFAMASQWGACGSEGDASVLLPSTLAFGASADSWQAGSGTGDDDGEGGSVGSLDDDDHNAAAMAAVGLQYRASREEAARPTHAEDPRYAGEGEEEGEDEARQAAAEPWPGARGTLFEHAQIPLHVDGEHGPAGGDSGEADGAVDGVADESSLRATHIAVYGPRRDLIGLAAQGRHCYCDYHDCDGTDALACMACDMLEQGPIQRVRDKQQRRRRKPGVDADGREARHAMYKAVIRWQWASPLGAENRVRLPDCVVHRIRRLFPNPRCTAGCDYLQCCERAGHYVGFRTAAESRAHREGRFVEVES